MTKPIARVEGRKELEEILREIAPREALNLARNTVQAIAQDLRRRMKQKAPVGETRQLSTRISARRRKPRDGIARSSVTVAAPHAIHVEYGTQKMDAIPFITPSVEELRPQIPTLYRELFGKKYEQLLARNAKRTARAVK